MEMELESESCTISQVSFSDHHSRPRSLRTRLNKSSNMLSCNFTCCLVSLGFLLQTAFHMVTAIGAVVTAATGVKIF